MPNKWSRTLGSLIFKQRVEHKLPLRKVAAALDIDTSTLSKIEKGKSQADLSMIPIIAELFKLDFKKLQTSFLTEAIKESFANEKYFKEAINSIIKSTKEIE